MQARVTGLHHIALKAQNEETFEKTVSFYREVLGLLPLRSWGEGERAGVMLSFGEGCMEIFASGEEVPSVGAIRHFAFRTEDVDALVERARASGCAVTVEPKDIEIPSEVPLLARIAFLVGPCGEEIELFCER